MSLLVADRQEAFFGAPLAADAVRFLACQSSPLPDATVRDFVLAQVRRRPDALAVSDDSGSLTYAELRQAADQVAARLRDAGVEAGDMVGVSASRGRAWVAAILGVWLIGAVYLPIEPGASLPAKRAMLKRARPACVLVDAGSAGSIAALLAEAGQAPMMLGPATQVDDAPAPSPVPMGPDHVAYVIFTSGSTGEPKGAVVTHRGLLNHLLAKIEDLRISNRDRIAATAPIGFDISIWQVWAVLAAGGQCHLASDADTHDPTRLGNFLRSRGVTIAQLVPSMVRAVLASGADFRDERRDPLSLRLLSLTGEAAPAGLCREWLRRYPSTSLLNAYGPTECSDDVTHHLFDGIDGLWESSTPIGRPVRNAQLFLLKSVDGQWQSVPDGEAGELFVAGPCVGLGYLDDPARTAENFGTVETGSGQLRCYRTGDIVRMLPNGLLDFIGRADRQIKIRGQRLELGGIEAAVEATGLASQAVADYRAPAPGSEAQLCFYLLLSPAGAELGPAGLGEALRRALPTSMWPDRCLPIDRMPLTPNGKIDIKQLRSLGAIAG